MNVFVNCLKRRAHVWRRELCHLQNGQFTFVQQASIQHHTDKQKLPRAIHFAQAGFHIRFSSRTFSSSHCLCKRNKNWTDHSKATKEDNDDEDNYSDDEGAEDVIIEESEVDELFEQLVPTTVGHGDHRVFIVHPEVKWGSKKQHLTTGELWFKSVKEWNGITFQMKEKHHSITVLVTWFFFTRHYFSLPSWASNGRGGGSDPDITKLDSSGQDHNVHKDTRKEEDIWQGQLPNPYRFVVDLNGTCLLAYYCGPLRFGFVIFI